MADEQSIKGLDRQLLNACRMFYVKYPQICATVSHKLQGIDYFPENLVVIKKKIREAICETVSRKFETPPELLVTRLSFSHIKEIMTIDDPMERFFYELECIKGTWGVRELHRQIDTKLYFRSGISKKPELLLQRVEKGDVNAALSVKDAYTLDFLDLDAKDAFSETELEQAIMNHLQEFLLEMGKGLDGDNPPIGILLCTEKGPKMVQYVLNGMDERVPSP
ncbi:PDDEXK nuclease domain-containing protein [Fibrobacter sp. UWH4]|uniref:PDDEXK nuclease domain-containing protein n=1 Tax=Fibrobacter sp. UWH4 TaxID=1896210 RepID=UPI001587A3C3|nr:PDDEXK nuclease domain-containing protein [Fibrobacter sp. UWH4]